MNKHVLMLTAATVALMAGPAFAATSTTITSKVTDAQATSTTGNLDIGSGGSVVVTLGSAAVTADTSDTIKLSTSGSLISNLNTSGAIGVQLEGTDAGQGPGAGTAALDSYGTIDLTGTGTSKTGVIVKGSSSSTAPIYNGDIMFETGSALKVSGDGSVGIAVSSGTTLNGNVTILGALTGTPTTVNSTASGNLTGVYVAGNMNGDFLVDTSGAINVAGQSSIGVNLAGMLDGSFINKGTINAAGTGAPSATKTNAEASSAVIIGNSVTGGIYNYGPTATGTSTALATISGYGASPALSIVPASTVTGDVTIGAYAGSDAPTTPYDLVNRGTIIGQPLNADHSASAVNIAGTSTYAVNLLDGIYNAGKITATTTTDLNASATTFARTIIIGNNANVGTLMNNGSESGNGLISATVSGTKPGEADALYIAASANTSGSLPAGGMTLTNSGTISASASTTDTTITSLSAYAIRDMSGTLRTINNSGTISASTTTLDSGAQVSVAADLSHATDAVTFTNTGSVTGDVLLGVGDDTVTVGDGSSQSYILGNIDFGNGHNYLTVKSEANVTGAVTAGAVGGGGYVDVTVGDGLGTGTLTLTNSSQGLRVGTMLVQDGATLGLTVTEASNISSSSYVSPVIEANSGGSITLTSGSNFKLNFGSFISTPGGTGTSQFVLLDAPSGNLAVNNYSAIALQINGDGTSAHPGEIPFLFTGGICTYNVGASSDCASGSATDSQLVLNLKPKTVQELGLSTNAATIFAPANVALGNDDTLGAAVINSVTDTTTAQDTYSAFLPDLSGSSRAVAIALTDQATGPVGAHQRALRMYAAQPGGTTMWGQEFVQRLNSGGNAEAYRATGFGFILGADSGSPESGRYGGAFTFFSGDQTNKATNFTKTSNEWYMLTGYTDWRGKGLFLDSQLGFGYGNLNGKRYLNLTNATTGVTTTRKAVSKRAGLLLAGGLTTGAIFTYGGTVLVPQISLDALTMREEGYTETGGGDGFNLKVQPYYANSVRGYFGTTVRQDIDFDGFYLQPEGRIGYRYDFLADPVKLKAAFASVGNQFSLTGPDPERGNLVAGGGLAVTTGSWSLGLNYDYIRGTNGAVSQSGTITLVGRI